MAEYNSYKESGVSWIGRVPSDWPSTRLRYYLSLEKGRTPSDLTLIPNGNLPYLTMDYLRGRDDKTIQYPVDSEGLKQVNEGDILVLWDGANAGEITRAKNGYLSSTMALISFDHSKFIEDYLFFFLKALEPVLKDFSSGTTIPHFDSTILLDKPYCIPSVDEQKRIVSFLNSKYDSLNSLINEKQSLVDSLKSYRDSVITELVTKGPYADVSMKESGVDWIGEIPQDWLVYKTNWAFKTIGSGTTPDTNNGSYYTSEGGINWLQTGDLNDGVITETSKHITKEALKNCHLQIYPKGSIVVAMYGATIGKVGILDIDCATNQACCVMTDSELLDKDYAYYIFLASKQSLVNKANGGGQPNISQAIIRNHRIPVPPIETQKQIVSEIRSRLGSVDDILRLQEEQIALIKDYRDALVFEAVTGKFMCID